MINTVWSIDWMNASAQIINGFTEVVLNAQYRCTSADTSTPLKVVSVCNNVTFPEPQTGGSFTPYADLTQEQVLGWCWENGVDKASIENQTIKQLEALLNPPTTQPPLPWATLSKPTDVP
jgi:hypothetical protein